MKVMRVLLAFAASALLLAACNVTVTPGPTPTTPDVSFSAPTGTTINPSPQRTLTVPAGAARLVQVTYPSNPDADLMYFEVNDAAGIRVELLTVSGNSVALFSRSPSLFADRAASLSAASWADEAPEAAAIGIGYECLGPCVATPYRSGTRLVRLVNEGSSSRNVGLLAYGFQFDDLGEPNDTPATASQFTVTDVGQGPSGAIEHVNDRDFHEIRCAPSFPQPSLRLTLSTPFAGDMVLIAGGVTYGPGQPSAFIPCTSVVEVRTRDGTAGPSGASRYSIVVD